MAFQTLELNSKEEKDGKKKILTVALNRPDVRNAFNPVVMEELTQVFQKEATSDEIRAVVLRGNGKVFSAGGDLNWMKESAGWSRDKNLEDTNGVAQMFHVMNEFPKPLLGAVHGAAIGGGVGLVSVCDFVVAQQDTVFSLSEVRLGLVPACVGPFVISKIGPSNARRFFTCGERFKATKAKEIGLVHEVASDAKDLESILEKILENISLCGPLSMAAAKKLVLDLSWPERRQALGNPLGYVAEMLANLRVSEEGQEGFKAFLEKRKPSWK